MLNIVYAVLTWGNKTQLAMIYEFLLCIGYAVKEMEKRYSFFRLICTGELPLTLYAADLIRKS